MTDTTATDTTDTDDTTATDVTDEQVEQEADPQAELSKWKALARQNEARAKANAEKAVKFDELTEAQKTDLQKAEDRAIAAEQRATEAILNAERKAIAATTGVDPALLTGTTAEALQASADALLAWRGTAAPAAPRIGGADINGGAAKPVIYTRAQIANPEFFTAHRADILAAQRQGRITS